MIVKDQKGRVVACQHYQFFYIKTTITGAWLFDLRQTWVSKLTNKDIKNDYVGNEILYFIL